MKPSHAYLGMAAFAAVCALGLITMRPSFIPVLAAVSGVSVMLSLRWKDQGQ